MVKSKITCLIIFICILFSVDFFALLKIQVLDSNKYYVLSEKNRIRIYPLFPKRGEIYDRNDRKIAINVPNYRLIMVNAGRKEILTTLQKLKGVIDVDINTDDLKYKTSQTNSYFIVKDMLSWEEYAKLAIHLDNIDRLMLGHVYNRQYNNPLAVSHVVGYIGMDFNNISGKAGLEYSQNDILSGILGNRTIEVNSRMKFIREIDIVKPIDGENIKLTIDMKLQEFIYKILSDHKSAACVVIDLRNGHILSAVSVPGFDINAMSKRISVQDWGKIVDDKYHPMNDRIFGSVYPPGSVFKMFIAYAALESGKISPHDKIRCNGCTVLGKDKFHCWKRTGHGLVDMSQAITVSCDVYFHEIARRVGIDSISDYSHKFGFGEHTCEDIRNEKTGLVPSKKWKLDRYKSPWKEYETILISTGQGYILANIMQVATAVSKLASGNFNFSPTLLFNKNGNDNKKELNSKIAEELKKAMYRVCNSPKGTAKSSCCTHYGIAGKTGSSQVRRLKAGEQGIAQNLLKWEARDHALFVGFAPYESPRYVVAVIVEHGGGGGSVAAPIARQIFDWLMNEYN